MSKRKLQVFYHEKGNVYVIESHVKQIMKMATDGEFTKLETIISSPTTDCKLGYVTFKYITNLGEGEITLEGQK